MRTVMRQICAQPHHPIKAPQGPQPATLCEAYPQSLLRVTVYRRWSYAAPARTVEGVWHAFASAWAGRSVHFGSGGSGSRRRALQTASGWTKSSWVRSSVPRRAVASRRSSSLPVACACHFGRLWSAEAAPEQSLDHDSNASEAAGRRRQPIPPGYPRGHGRKPLAPNDAKAITREPALGPAPASPGVPRFLVIVQQTQAGYSAHVPDLPGCFTSAASGGEVENAVRTAIAAHLQQLRIAEEEPPGSRSYAMVVEIPVSPS